MKEIARLYTQAHVQKQKGLSQTLKCQIVIFWRPGYYLLLPDVFGVTAHCLPAHSSIALLCHCDELQILSLNINVFPDSVSSISCDLFTFAGQDLVL